jgi:hypothetical protein
MRYTLQYKSQKLNIFYKESISREPPISAKNEKIIEDSNRDIDLIKQLDEKNSSDMKK